MKKVKESKTLKYQLVKASLGTLVVSMSAFSGIFTPIQFGILMMMLNIADTMVSTYLRYLTTEAIEADDIKPEK